MEITLDLDDDVSEGIQAILADNPDKSFEQIVNELFRIGFANAGISNDGETLTA